MTGLGPEIFGYLLSFLRIIGERRGREKRGHLLVEEEEGQHSGTTFYVCWRAKGVGRAKRVSSLSLLRSRVGVRLRSFRQLACTCRAALLNLESRERGRPVASMGEMDEETTQT